MNIPTGRGRDRLIGRTWDLWWVLGYSDLVDGQISTIGVAHGTGCLRVRSRDSVSWMSQLRDISSRSEAYLGDLHSRSWGEGSSAAN